MGKQVALMVQERFGKCWLSHEHCCSLLYGYEISKLGFSPFGGDTSHVCLNVQVKEKRDAVMNGETANLGA